MIQYFSYTAQTECHKLYVTDFSFAIVGNMPRNLNLLKYQIFQ